MTTVRTLTTILTIMIFGFGCKNGGTNFPDKKDVLTTEFTSYKNFFPIATLNLSKKGIKDKIHIIYVSFDPNIDHHESFPNGDCIDEFTFRILDNGLYEPTFDSTVLTIGESFKKYFAEGQTKFKMVKQKNNISTLIKFTDKPEWWQDDQTPKNSKGQPMTFICQLDIYEVFNDDCRLFIFYDQEKKIVKYIYQRT